MATTDLHARTSSPFLELLHDQIRNEFTASQQYIAIAVYFDDADLPQLAKRFYAQAVEERNHAMMIIRYLIDKNVAITIPGVDAVVTEFADARAPIALALEQEKRVTDQVTELARAARSAGDYYGEQFMQWFTRNRSKRSRSWTPCSRSPNAPTTTYSTWKTSSPGNWLVPSARIPPRPQRPAAHSDNFAHGHSQLRTGDKLTLAKLRINQLACATLFNYLGEGNLIKAHLG